MEDEFVISHSKLSLFKQYQSHISSLFAVGLQIVPRGTVLSADHCSLVWIQVKSRSADLSEQQQQQDVKNAKEYILSLVGDDEECCTESVRFSREQFDWLQRHVTDIEANSRAVINVRNDEFSLQIHGYPVNRALAYSRLDFLLQGNASREGPSPNADAQRPVGFKSRGEMGGHRTKLPLPHACLSPCDSCYGSGDECLNHSSAVVYPPPPPPRTDKPGVRDARVPSPPGSGSQSDSPSSSESDLDTIKSDSAYIAKVQFGVKLGYSEAQVLSVLQKCGIDAPQNDILSELVSLGSSSHTPQAASNLVKGKLDSSDMDSGCLSGSGVGVENIGGRLDMVRAADVSLPLTTETDLSYPKSSDDTDTGYRPIVIDGSNVAMSHGNKAVFSCRGIQLAVDWFKKKGCEDITVFVPQWRKESPRQDAPIEDQHILTELEQERILAFTPARRIGGKRMVCYDDRYVLKLAAETGGIVVSNDNYRDLLDENKEFKRVVEERLLMYSFVRDMFMPPDDPLGRHGPSLENFLRKEPTEPEPMPPPCPYGKKCTYGNKCKYYHPERGNLPQKTITEKLAEQTKQSLLEVTERSKTDKKRSGKKLKRALTRTDSAGTTVPLNPPPRPPRKPINSLESRHSPFSDILENKAVDNPVYKAYNDKLSELSKNIPADNHGQGIGKAALVVPEVSLISAPPEYGETGLRPPLELAKARASPQLVTGHLELAQTLSDEANREQRQKSLLQQQEELKQDLKRGLHPLAYEPSPEGQLQRVMEQQLHIQELPCPRGASPGYGQPKEDYRVQYSQPQYLSDPFSSYATTIREGTGSFQHTSYEGLQEHQGLARVHSITQPPAFMPSHSRPASMNRQNSTSDPVLNKPDAMSSKAPAYGHVFNPMYSHGQSSHYPPAYPAQHPYDATLGQYHLVSPPNIVPQGYYQMPGPPQAMMPPEVGGIPADTPILPTDKRYSLYYNLCGLFKEPDVRAIMNKLPYETNPQVLCARLLSLNQ